MTHSVACPDVKQYQQLVINQLKADEQEDLFAHLAGCDICAQKLTATPAQDTLIDLIRKAQTLSDSPSGLIVARLVERLSKLRPQENRSASVPGDRTEVATAHSSPSASNQDVYHFLAPAQAPGELGRLGTYRVLKVLGVGGMGIVFLAEDTLLNRPVALKAMLPALASGETARQRFLREARAAAAIRHDHVVTIYQVGEDRGVPYLAMELLAGESLESRLEREKTLPAKEVMRIGRELAVGLAAAHEKGLIHRDIKPANIWLEAGTGRVKILDFGLARVGAEGAQLTQSGAIVGTPAYMAPEQGRGLSVGPRADLFSLGCVLYRMVTGSAAFKAVDIISTLLAVATATPRPPIEINAALPVSLSELIVRLLAKAPEDRPASAEVVATELGRMDREPNPAPVKSIVPGPAKPAGRPGRGWYRWVGVATALFGTVLTALWAGGVFRVKTKEGVLVVEVNEPNPEVTVDGELVTVTWADGGKKAEIRIKPGTRKVEVKKDGFTIHGEEVTVDDGGRRVLFASLAKFEMVGEKPKLVEPTVAFLPIFNGKNLTGWTIDKGGVGSWKVVEGAITCSGPGSSLYTSRGNYGDFHLRAEVKINEAGNSGIYFRAGKPLQWVGDYEAQICTRGDQQKTGGLYGLVQVRDILVEPNTWFTYEIIAQGDRIKLLVNGKETANYQEKRPNRLTTGHIALQHHDAVSAVQFRKIEVKLQEPGASFFNGKD